LRQRQRQRQADHAAACNHDIGAVLRQLFPLPACLPAIMLPKMASTPAQTLCNSPHLHKQ
jgi:hypothetical protein